MFKKIVLPLILLAGGGFVVVLVVSSVFVLTGPGADKNPCAAKNPCSAKNPCAANPCAPSARAARSIAKAITVRGEIVKINPRTGKLVLKANGSQLDLTLARYSVVRQGPKVKTAKDIKRGDKATVSYVDSGGVRTAWYIYLALGASVANPCAANPCAARNPCVAKNPCAANPCAARNPCAAKTLNSCAAKTASQPLTQPAQDKTWPK